ncbi:MULTISPECIES: helix-turn-helix domain-containing protein [unclassified Streptomyces]|uniref:helix-turn-helix domain-containing protein n=1 Tax=unclassified Streptomyces TaxID=2593676 RepID=UPI00380653DC
MATGRIEMGPTARTVADNLRRLREARGMSLRALSAELKKVGRTLSADAINKIENGRTLELGAPEPKQIRRADVDDLIAFALVFNVSPLTLLLPPIASDAPADLTDSTRVRSRTAWRWGVGLEPAMEWEPGEGTNWATPGADPAIAAAAQEREQEYGRRRDEYMALALPPEMRRTAESPSVRLARQLTELVEDLASAESGGEAARVRMAQRRYQQLGIELEELEERFVPRPIVHPGVGFEQFRDRLAAEAGTEEDSKDGPGGK